MEITVGSLQSLRTEEHFSALYNDTVKRCLEMEIDPPELPRQRKLPLRIAGSSPSHVWKYAIEYYRSYYFQFIDVAIGALQRRYDQPGPPKYMLFKNVLLQSMPRNEIHDIQILKEYSDINVDALATQLDMYRQQGWKCQSIDDFTQQLWNMEGAARNLFSDVERLTFASDRFRVVIMLKRNAAFRVCVA
jgi:hypothetical protein